MMFRAIAVITIIVMGIPSVIPTLVPTFAERPQINKYTKMAQAIGIRGDMQGSSASSPVNDRSPRYIL